MTRGLQLVCVTVVLSFLCCTGCRPSKSSPWSAGSGAGTAASAAEVAKATGVASAGDQLKNQGHELELQPTGSAEQTAPETGDEVSEQSTGAIPGKTDREAILDRVNRGPARPPGPETPSGKNLIRPAPGTDSTRVKQ